MMVVWPTATPTTSVIASSEPVGKMPIFSPRSEERGRAVGVLFWATANAVNEKIVATAKNLWVMGVVYGQNSFENESRRSMLPAASARFG